MDASYIYIYSYIERKQAWIYYHGNMPPKKLASVTPAKYQIVSTLSYSVLLQLHKNI